MGGHGHSHAAGQAKFERIYDLDHSFFKDYQILLLFDSD